MTAKTDTFENDFLAYFLQGGSITNIPTATSGNFYIALFTAAPTDSTGGTETTYAGYARQAILRHSSGNGWSISGGIATNLAQINFPQCSSGGPHVITHFALMSAITGGTMYYYGALSASLSVSAGITPQIAATSLSIQEQ